MEITAFAVLVMSPRWLDVISSADIHILILQLYQHKAYGSSETAFTLFRDVIPASPFNTINFVGFVPSDDVLPPGTSR